MGDTTGISPKRGDVYLVNFDPTVGSEIQKTRPALILQNDIANRYSPVTIVAAITSLTGDTLYPSEVRIDVPAGGLDHASIVLLNQLRTVDIQHLVRKLGTLEDQVMEKVETALLISLGSWGDDAQSGRHVRCRGRPLPYRDVVPVHDMSCTQQERLDLDLFRCRGRSAADRAEYTCG